MVSYAPPPMHGAKRLIPADYAPHRIIDNMRRYERWRNDGNIGVQGVQVQAFILLRSLHAYIADARRDLENILGTRLCVEHCCCLRSTPMITRLEAEYIISSTGYYSDLLRIAEEWLLEEHACAPTRPVDLPAVLGGSPVPIAMLPQVAAEMRALAGQQSPYLIAEHSSAFERLTVGPWARTSYATGNAVVHAQNWDLLDDAQPLTCAVSGVFVVPPEHCTRRLGFGETAETRTVADPSTIKAAHKDLMKLYAQAPEKAQYGLLPMMILRAGNPIGFEKLVRDGRVALAKLGVTRGKFPFPLWTDPAGRAPASRLVFAR